MTGLRKSLESTTFVAVAAISIAFFYRFQIANGFTSYFGDRYDAMIEITILQHWMNVFHGLEPWNRTQYFYPAPDTLGYNDGYFVYGVLYSLFRALGLQLVEAQDAVHGLMKILGFFGMFWMLRTIGQCRYSWSLFGAALFTVADVTLQHSNHGQLFTVAFVPYAMIFAWRAIIALLAADRKRLLGYGTAFFAIYGLWIITAYYLAWFFTLFGLITISFLLVISEKPDRAQFTRSARSCLPQLAFLAIVSIITIVPFLSVYASKARETGMHAYGEARPSAFMPLDYFNTTKTNVAWGLPLDFLRKTIAPKLKENHDEIFGLTPLLFGLTIYAGIRHRKENSKSAFAAISFGISISWILMLKIFKFSPWYLVYKFVPGAAGVRVIGRFNLLLLVPAILLVTILLDRSRNKWLAMTLAGLLLIEQTNTHAPVQLDEADQLSMIANTPKPPVGCKSFFVVSARRQPYPVFDRANDHIYAHNVDAMVLSEIFHRPTVNGISTFMPPYWNFDQATAADYDARAKLYARQVGISPPCKLDVQHGQYWTAMPA